jgi:group I intron endonuclease
MSENKYQNGKIYKIWSLETDEIYVGSTCQPLHKRMHQHRSDSNQDKIYKLYQEMRRIGNQSFSIELIEDCPCNSKDELIKREGFWIRNLTATLNMKIAGRTKKEYNEENKEHISKYNKEYRKQNEDKVKEREKEYRKQNPDKVQAYMKGYHSINKDKIKEHKKEYRKQNADKIREHKGEQHICSVCGSTYTNCHKARHEKTQKHLKAVEAQSKDD